METGNDATEAGTATAVRDALPGAGPGPAPYEPLGPQLRGAQHFGLTVQNMDRAFEFYTEVLGGVEVIRDSDFQGADIHNILLTDQEILAADEGVAPASIGIPDLMGGQQRLDFRFIHFGTVALELLHYRNAEEPQGSGRAFAEPRGHMSPAYPRSMHVCFEVREDVDIDRFITNLEAESARRGMTQVKANRLVTVRSESARQEAPQHSNTSKIRQGPSSGWTLVYCKGPEGEQLEFVQAINPIRQAFEQAQQRYLGSDGRS